MRNLVMLVVGCLGFATGCEGRANTADAALPSVPPSGLTYSTNPATYTNGVVIVANTPSSSGGCGSGDG